MPLDALTVMSRQTITDSLIPLRGARLVVLCVPVLLVAVILLRSPNFQMSSGPQAEPFGGDYIQEWTGGWMLHNGDRSRFYDPAYISTVEHDSARIGFEWDQDAYLPMVYPPFWYLLVSPLSGLPLTSGAVVWTWLMAAALVGALLLLRQWLIKVHGDLNHSPAVLLAASLLVYPPLIESLGSGQKGTLLLLLFTATFVLLDGRRPFWAGVVFALVAFKPQLTLVIGVAMLLKREWRFIAGGVTMGTILVGLSFAAGGDLCRQYFELCSGMGEYVKTGGYDLHKAHCWWGACQLLLGGAPDGIIKACAGAGSLVTIALLASILRGELAFGTGSFARQFAALTIATLLLSPHLFTYDLTLLLLALFLLTCGPGALDARFRWLPVVMFVVAGLSADLARSTGVQISVLLMLGLLVLVDFTRKAPHSLELRVHRIVSRWRAGNTRTPQTPPAARPSDVEFRQHPSTARPMN